MREKADKAIASSKANSPSRAEAGDAASSRYRDLEHAFFKEMDALRGMPRAPWHGRPLLGWIPRRGIFKAKSRQSLEKKLAGIRRVLDEPEEENRLYDMWFFNGDGKANDGSIKAFPIRFLKREIVDCYRIRIFRKGREFRGREDFDRGLEDPSFNLHGTWDFMLIELFESRFAIRRIVETGNDGKSVESFIIHSRPALGGSPHSGKDCARDDGNGEWDDGRTMRIVKQITGPLDCAPGSPALTSENTINPGAQCKYMLLSNKKIVIAQNRILAEPICCRTILLYLLAKAYTYKLKKMLDELSYKALFNNRSGFWAWLGARLGWAAPLLHIGPYHAINNINEEIVKFKNLYFYSLPINLYRVEELAATWDDLYSFYRIKEISEELNAKINDLLVLSRNSHASLMASYMFLFALVGLFLKAGDILNILSGFATSTWGVLVSLISP